MSGVFTVLSLVILFSPPSRAYGPLDQCVNEFIPSGPPAMSEYTRYLLADGILSPVLDVERLLAKINRVRQNDAIDEFLQRMGPAAEVLPRMSDMIHVAEFLTRVNRGYQALRVRCARVSEDLRTHRPVVDDLIRRTNSAVDALDHALSERPGRDTAWVRSQITRVHAAVADFKRACVDNPPPQAAGFWDAINRILTP